MRKFYILFALTLSHTLFPKCISNPPTASEKVAVVESGKLWDLNKKAIAGCRVKILRNGKMTEGYSDSSTLCSGKNNSIETIIDYVCCDAGGMGPPCGLCKDKDCKQPLPEILLVPKSEAPEFLLNRLRN